MKGIKNFFLLKNKSLILQVLSIAMVTTGIISGIFLVQQNQEIREKAKINCIPDGKCMTSYSDCCGSGFIDKTLCNSSPYTMCGTRCPNTDCNLPEPIPSNAVKCFLPGSNTTTYCCPSKVPLYDANKGKCINSGGGGGGGNEKTCGLSSAANCQGKKLGYTCRSGRECKDTGKVGNDGKIQCSCSISSGGGGGACIKDGECLDIEIGVCCNSYKNDLNCPITETRCISSGGGGGGGGGGGNEKTCGWASAANCQGKKPGDTCKPGKKCKDTGEKGSDGKLQCSCTGSGGGGTTPPEECENDFSNPATITTPKDGKLVIYYNALYTSENEGLQVAVKPGSSTCSLSDNAGVFDLPSSNDGKVETNLDVTANQTICFGVYYQQNDQTHWQEAEDNLCKSLGGEDLDISQLTQKAEEENNADSIASKQCWDNELTTCDFNDFALLFAVAEGQTTSEGLSFKIRFQGITKKAENQTIHLSIFSEGEKIKSWDKEAASNKDGTYTFTITKDMGLDAISAGTYDVVIKGNSHLQKRFTNVVYNGGSELIDLSKNKDHQLRAGDVDDNNAITIKDIAQVLSYYYGGFKIPVKPEDSKSKASDVNKDGYITIQDVALIAINWSDFKVKGDE